MKLLIMRHGEAELAAQSDMLRPLTPFGNIQTEHTAKWLLNNNIIPESGVDLALVSPYLRTRQTFNQLDQHIQFKEVEYSQDILPSSIVSLAHDYIDTKISMLDDPQCLMIVSHMPFVSYFIDDLCQKMISPLFATASVAVVDYDPCRSVGELFIHFQGN